MNDTLLNKILSSSTTKAINLARVYGTLSLKPLLFLDIVQEALDYNDAVLSTDQKRDLESFLICIQNKHKEICNYRSGYRTTSEILNRPPVIFDINVLHTEEGLYTITEDLITSTYSDPDGDLYETLRIVSLPADGILRYNGINVVVGQEIDLTDFGTFTYERINDFDLTDSFNFQISDNNLNKLFSNMAVFGIEILDQGPQPPTLIGDNSTTIDNKATYVFLTGDFTTNTTPAYSHPTSALAEFVKITSLPASGSLLLNGAIIPVNQLVSIADIDAGNFSYQASQVDETLHSTAWTFSVSDVDSHIFTAGGDWDINILALVNTPPIVGDNEIIEDEGDVTVFTRAMFTTNTTPEYFDPNGDAAWKLKPTSLPVNGTLKLNGVNVLINDEILFTDIDLGLLTYTQQANAGGTFESFNFQIADTGSGIFVS